MSFINKQTFLAELGKLLTFMYDEDRQEALSMYSRIFDEVSDEQALLQQLQSPTRQAVVIARSYDAKTSRLSVEAEKRSGTAFTKDGIPKFISIIEDIEEEALNREARYHAPLRGQRSLFDASVDTELPIESADADLAITEDSQAGSLLYAVLNNETKDSYTSPYDEPEIPDDSTEDDPIDPPVDDAPAVAASLSLLDFLAENAAQMISGETDVPDTTSVPAESSKEEDSSEDSKTEYPEEQGASEDVDSAESTSFEAVTTVETEEEENDEPSDLQKESDAVSEFLSNFSIDEGTSKTANEKKRTVPVRRTVPVIEEESRTRIVRSLSVPRVILYTIVAIPVCILLLALLLILTLCSAALAFTSVCGGAIIMTSAFSGFAVFADILVVLGAGLIMLALGLLFLWIFIWLIAAGMVGVVRNAIAMGRKFCTTEKEVSE